MAPTVPEWVRKGARPTKRRKKTADTSTDVKLTSASCKIEVGDLLQFERQGHLMLRGLLPLSEMAALQEEAGRITREGELAALRHRVRVLCEGVDPDSIGSVADARAALRSQAAEDVGFLQFFNNHRRSAVFRRLVRAPELAGAAAELLGCDRVRLYQDCLFLKQPGMAETNWHSDLRMAPLDTNAFLTMWIPLRDIGEHNDSGLMFALGSHRDFAAAFWHDLSRSDLSRRGYTLRSTGAMTLGDVSCHHGWTLHAAPPQAAGSPARIALAVSYFADGARVFDWDGDKSLRKELRHLEDLESYADWLPACKGGSLARHANIPLVYDRRNATGAV